MEGIDLLLKPILDLFSKIGMIFNNPLFDIVLVGLIIGIILKLIHKFQKIWLFIALGISIIELIKLSVHL